MKELNNPNDNGMANNKKDKIKRNIDYISWVVMLLWLVSNIKAVAGSPLIMDIFLVCEAICAVLCMVCMFKISAIDDKKTRLWLYIDAGFWMVASIGYAVCFFLP